MKNKIFKTFLAILLVISLSTISNTSAAGKTSDLSSPMVSTGWGQTALLTPDGYMIMYGNNEIGQIGNGENGDFNWDTDDCIVLKPYVTMKDVKYISVQNYSCFAIKKDNTLWSWGFDHRASLGNGPLANNTATPTRILTDVKFVATGHGLHMLAIKEDNTLWAWGQNDYGQVGNGKKTDVETPVKVMDGVIYAAVGYGNSAVIKEDGSLWMWGRNDHGELGYGTEATSTIPKKIMDEVKTVTMGFHRTVVLKKDGTVWAWGQNDHGEIGDGTYTERHSPTKVQGMSKVTAISMKAEGHMLALRKDGTVWAWGNNEGGALGDGTRINRLKPVKVLSGVKAIDTNEGFSVAIKKDNTVWAWGVNSSGQLGTGDKKDCLKPAKVFDLTKMLTDGTCTVPAIYVDGNLDDWEDKEPIYRDTSEVDSGKKPKLETIYAYMDKKNLYMAVKLNIKNPKLHVNFNIDEDPASEANVGVDYTRNIMFISIATGKDTWEDGSQLQTCNYVDGLFELTIPLSEIGNPKKLTLNTMITTLGSDTRYEMKDYMEVPVITAKK